MHARMWVHYEGLEKLKSPKLYADISIMSKYRERRSIMSPYIEISGTGIHLELHNAVVTFEYQAMRIAGSEYQKYVEGVGFIETHQEVTIISNMLTWEALGGIDADREHKIVPRSIEVFLEKEDREAFNKGKVSVTANRVGGNGYLNRKFRKLKTS